MIDFDSLARKVKVKPKQIKKFPIQNAAACQFKWTWSTVFLNRGTTASCHRGHHWSINGNTIMDFHNHPGKIQDREKMLKGEWPGEGSGCEYCRDVEQAGGISERIAYVNEMGDMAPPEMDTDPTATHVTPRIVEVYFNNTCNQMCIYCTPAFSSKIEQEVRKYGQVPLWNQDYSEWKEDARPRYELYKQKFWEWMKLYGKDVYILKILGGEPMYQEEFLECLQFFDENPMPQMTWRIFTNMNHDPKKFREKLEFIKRLINEKKLKGIDVVCSIDCWGPELEYTRYGLSLADCEANMETLLEMEEIGVLVHSTLTVLSLPYMYKLVEKVLEWQKRKPILFGWNTVTRPEIFNMYSFGGYLVPYIDKALDIFDKNGGLNDYQSYLRGMKDQQWASEVDVDQINKMVAFLDELDIRRKCDWKSKIPEVAYIVEEIRKRHG